MKTSGWLVELDLLQPDVRKVSTMTTVSLDPTPTHQLESIPLPVTHASVPHRVQSSYTTRFVGAALAARPAEFHLRSGEAVVPRSGDVVIARVTEILNHRSTRLNSSHVS